MGEGWINESLIKYPRKQIKDLEIMVVTISCHFRIHSLSSNKLLESCNEPMRVLLLQTSLTKVLHLVTSPYFCLQLFTSPYICLQLLTSFYKHPYSCLQLLTSAYNFLHLLRVSYSSIQLLTAPYIFLQLTSCSYSCLQFLIVALTSSSSLLDLDLFHIEKCRGFLL